MVKALLAEFQGRSYLVRGLQILLICFIYRWSLNYLSALIVSFLLSLLLPRLTRTIIEPICSLSSWRT